MTRDRSHGRRMLLALLLGGLLAGSMLPGALGAAAAQGPPALHNYRVDGVSTNMEPNKMVNEAPVAVLYWVPR